LAGYSKQKTRSRRESDIATKKLIPKLGQKFRNGFLLVEMTSSGWIFHQLHSFNGSDDANWLSTFQLLQLSKKFLLNSSWPPGAFDMVAAISAQGSHVETFAQFRNQFLRLKESTAKVQNLYFCRVPSQSFKSDRTANAVTSFEAGWILQWVFRVCEVKEWVGKGKTVCSAWRYSMHTPLNDNSTQLLT
jgi:hypothetical protein